MAPGMRVESRKELQQVHTEVARGRRAKSQSSEIQTFGFLDALPEGRLRGKKMLKLGPGRAQQSRAKDLWRFHLNHWPRLHSPNDESPERAKRVWTGRRRFERGQDNRLIRADPRALVHRMRVTTLEQDVLFSSS